MALTLLSSPPEPCLSHHPSFWRVQSDDPSEPNLRVDATIRNGMETVGIDSLPADASGIVAHELSEYFKTLFQPSFTFPDTGQPFRVVPENIKHLGIIFEEFSGTPPTEVYQLDIQEHPVIYGRIPDYLHTWFYRNYNSFSDYLTLTKNFLTFWPSSHKVTKTQTEKLFFCNWWWTSGHTLKCYVTLRFTDGTSSARYQAGNETIPMARQYLVWEFHTGYTALAIGAYIKLYHQGKTVESYEVEIGISPSDIRSAKHTYIIDNDYYPNRREFIFRNPLGGYDTFVATGKAETISEYEPEIIDELTWYNASGNARKILRTTFGETIECNSGFVSKDITAAMPQFFESDDVYEIVSGKLYPVGFPKQQITRKTDRNGLSYFTFTYSYMPIHKIETAQSGSSE